MVLNLKTVCSVNSDHLENSKDKDFRFLCMDLTFIYALLSNGYGLPHDKQIHVYQQVNNMEISWALGAAFHMLND